jgi:predicted ATP-grasp superfamily ATP-dependent carboligase
MAYLIIPDYPGQQVISGIRALSREGDTCELAWKITSLDKIFKSKHISQYHQIPPASTDPNAYINELVELCKNHNYDGLIPFGNYAYYAIVNFADHLKELVRFLVPSKKAFQIAHDKSKTIQFCKKIGIHVPYTYTDFERDDLATIAKEVKFPIVIKARSGTGVKMGLRYANTAQELFEKFDEITSFESKSLAESYRSPLIQEFIPGYIHDVCSVSFKGKVLNILTQVRQLMYPITGGVGAINYTTHNDDLIKTSRMLLEALDWNGPTQIEYKYDPRDGKYKLIEINPKLWGTLDLSIKTGMNFPGMIRDILLDKKVAKNTYPTGVRYIFHYSQASYARWQLVREFGLGALKSQKKFMKTYHDFDYKDMLPDIYRMLTSLLGAIVGIINFNTANLPSQYINTPSDRSSL